MSLRVEGAPPDSDGFLVAVDDTNPQLLMDGESYVFGLLATGTHTVAISDVPSPCSVHGERSRRVDVVADHTIVVPFLVDCPAPGIIEVVVRSAGSTRDADGYLLTLDETTTRFIGVSGVETFADLPVGEHDIELTGVAVNCSVPGGTQMTVTVREDDATRVDFGIACPPFYDHIAFSSNRDGGTDIFVMQPDGSNPVNLTTGSVSFSGEPFPSWSPDATSIAFTAGDGWPDKNIHILDTVDMSLRQVTSGGSISLCDWSPDGARLVYSSSGNVYVMDVYGSNPVNLTPGPEGSGDPAWSPDGSQIAFVRAEPLVGGGGGGSNVWVMDADGSNATKLTDLVSSMPAGWSHFAWEPAWSPDGTRIAFSGPGEQADRTIWVVEADGSNPTQLTADLLGYQAWRPSWSPTGSHITYWVFNPDDGYCYQIYVMEADGSNRTNITNHQSCNTVPDWSSGS